MTRAADPVRVLFVCTGNICRSPAAAALAESLSDGAVLATSAGTAPVTGAEVHPFTLAALQRRGVHFAGPAGRPITRRLVESADLVLGMTRGHRAHAVRTYPPVLRRAFTLRELSRLVARAEAPTEAGAREWALDVGRWRGLAADGDDDVMDPIRGPAQAHEEVVALLERELRVVLAPLARIARVRR
ncbi:arsenate-mycothiol transferase ArsC [Motilibacter deserti]|uniref:Low molecular weight phosphatase family protein n=1 Tax=Motilibacter deserti TaxID=2714956 RepID=A0ABX0GWJ1_9ACTN|nr:low molecular weight phosphatase family protein [Motilibacter deserti]